MAKRKATNSVMKHWSTEDQSLTVTLSIESDKGGDLTADDVVVAIADDNKKAVTLAVDLAGLDEVIGILRRVRALAAQATGTDTAEEAGEAAEEEEDDDEADEEEDEVDEDDDEDDEDEEND